MNKRTKLILEESKWLLRQCRNSLCLLYNPIYAYTQISLYGKQREDSRVNRWIFNFQLYMSYTIWSVMPILLILFSMTTLKICVSTAVIIIATPLVAQLVFFTVLLILKHTTTILN